MSKIKNKIVFGNIIEAYDWFDKNNFVSLDSIFWYKRNTNLWCVFVDNSVTARFFKNKLRRGNGNIEKVPSAPPKSPVQKKKNPTKPVIKIKKKSTPKKPKKVLITT